MKHKIPRGEEVKDLRYQSIGKVICADIKISKNYDRTNTGNSGNDSQEIRESHLEFRRL
jgi:hypothetical protein